MKITSELTGKEYKTVDECLKAEEEYKKGLEEKSTTEAKKLNELGKEKKLLAKAIEEAEDKVREAENLYEVARQKAADILDESNKQVEKILSDAREKVKQAEEEKLNAVMKFNKEFGTYKTVITGEKAAEEYNKAVKRFDNMFKDFMKFWF